MITELNCKETNNVTGGYMVVLFGIAVFVLTAWGVVKCIKNSFQSQGDIAQPEIEVSSDSDEGPIRPFLPTTGDQAVFGQTSDNQIL